MAFPYPYSGPIALYNNLPIERQNYRPRLFFISGVSLGTTTTVTTIVNHDYVIGQECRLIIPLTNGCRELNEVKGFVISIPATNEVVLDIDSSQNVTPFQISTANTQPQILAIGDVNTGAINDHGRFCTKPFIPGSFRDISPQGPI